MRLDTCCVRGLNTAAIRILLLLGIASLLSTGAAAQNALPQPILPETLRWIERPGGLPLQAAWVLGAESKPEPYLIRVQLAAGGRIPPHTHPDARRTTVLSGTLYVGFGATFDAAHLVAAPTGAVYVAPAEVPHFLEARDGAVVYQEAGVGPTGTTWVKP
ncbi:MAG: cupin domain-containing protein [Candidatus Competibacteraceae bacterium]|nr:cupin domain-containing protein [Candidatus Competibacteraceae bacterium]